MIGIVAKVKNVVPPACQTSKYSKDGCSVSMKGAPPLRVMIDMDCKELGVQGSRCDYLFVGEHQNRAWVVPIELKSGKVRASEVRDQLQGGAQFAQTILATGDHFNFGPVLAHGKSIHRLELNKLRQARISLGSKIQQPKLIKCGEPVAKVLN